jgi:hypothetical protein
MKQFLRFAASAAVVMCAYWNVVAFDLASENIAPRESDEIVVQEKRLAPIRGILMQKRYLTGQVGFITNHSLAGLPPTPDDDKRWGQSQYVMIPWVLERNNMTDPFMIADFSDGQPPAALDHLSALYDSGDGLVLFQIRQ